MRIVSFFSKKVSFLGLCLCLVVGLQAQDLESPMYNVNRYVSGSIGVVGTITNYIGLNRILSKDSIPAEKVLALRDEDVNRFDRVALRQSLDFVDQAKILSDIGLYASFALPAVLFFDKEIGKEWKDISLLYFETQAIAANMYSWSPLGPTFNERYRPSTYYEELTLEDRRFGRKRNSFFSGHVSTTATASFFMAKVYCDFHPELGAKKWLIYTAAAVPPAFVGLFRVKSLNHFPTDTIAGTIIGGAVGILMPHFHKNKNKKNRLGLSSIPEGYGLAMLYRF